VQERVIDDTTPQGQAGAPHRRALVLLDSVAKIEPAHAGAVVVTGSHGGTSSAGFVLDVPVFAIFFNDAGIGKDEAGIAGLALLQAAGIAACAVSHASARIGEAGDTLHSGVVTAVNPAGAARGIRIGARAVDCVDRLRR
jgi:hypothetical protein